MMRSYDSPEAFKQALEHRLREVAAARATDLARIRQVLVFDRFLARAGAVLGERLLVKGGVVVELRLEHARATKDVDLSVTGDFNAALSELQEAGRLDLGDWLRYEVTEDPRHPDIEAEGMRYQGKRFRARATLAGRIYGTSFGIDVAVAEPIVGAVDQLVGSRLLEFAGVNPPIIRVYPIESHVAEKLHAYTLPRDRPNSRVKDLPDIALLASTRALRSGELRAALERTFAARATHELPPAVPAPPSQWEDLYARLADTEGLPWSTLESLLDAVRAFLDPILSSLCGTWDPDAWAWRADGDGA